MSGTASFGNDVAERAGVGAAPDNTSFGAHAPGVNSPLTCAQPVWPAYAQVRV
ncbi:hypothetical protein DM39_4033 [Burkholderia cenocepacia]|uniref:Uncharacterized protein n=1 Tax=Burkholderia cenocepacia TaxID=95486 RepID=A0AAN0RV06_9BURK|nr:hypothetical protein DM39_4033 [Burkholderia cenocepacia]